MSGDTIDGKYVARDTRLRDRCGHAPDRACFLVLRDDHATGRRDLDRAVATIAAHAAQYDGDESAAMDFRSGAE